MKLIGSLFVLAAAGFSCGGCAHKNLVGGYTLLPSVVQSEVLNVVGDFDRPAFARSMPEILVIYPFDLERAGLTGSVVVRVDVAPTGQIAGLTILSSSIPEFGEAVRNGMARGSFNPAMKDGVAVACSVEYRISFQEVDEL